MIFSIDRESFSTLGKVNSSVLDSVIEFISTPFKKSNRIFLLKVGVAKLYCKVYFLPSFSLLISKIGLSSKRFVYTLNLTSPGKFKSTPS